MSENSETLDGILRLSVIEQNKLIFEFLLEDQKFVNFLNSKMHSKFREGDLISNGNYLYRVCLMCPDGLPYCEYIMAACKEISEEQYEKGEMSLRARFLSYEEPDFDDCRDEERPLKKNVESFEKVESLFFLKGYRRFNTGNLKKTPNFFAVLDQNKTFGLENCVSKIGKIKVF